MKYFAQEYNLCHLVQELKSQPQDCEIKHVNLQTPCLHEGNHERKINN